MYFMVVAGIGALASLGLALPTGLAFGYGYGYGVRAGYNSFKQPSSEVRKLKLSANPVTGALGAGLQSAEERTGVPVLGSQPSTPSLGGQTDSLLTSGTSQEKDIVYSKSGKYAITREQKNKMSREQYSDWYHEVNATTSRQSYMPNKLTRSPKYRYRY